MGKSIRIEDIDDEGSWKPIKNKPKKEKTVKPERLVSLLENVCSNLSSGGANVDIVPRFLDGCAYAKVFYRDGGSTLRFRMCVDSSETLSVLDRDKGFEYSCLARNPINAYRGLIEEVRRYLGN